MGFAKKKVRLIMATEFDIKSYFASKTDEELSELLQQAKDDLEKITDRETNSEWHEACFSAVIMTSEEIQRRNKAAQKIVCNIMEK